MIAASARPRHGVDPHPGAAVEFIRAAAMDAADALPMPPDSVHLRADVMACRIMDRMDTAEFREAVTKAVESAAQEERERLIQEYRQAAASAFSMSKRLEEGETFRAPIRPGCAK